MLYEQFYECIIRSLKKVNHSFKHLHFCHVLRMTVPSTLTVVVRFFFLFFIWQCLLYLCFYYFSPFFVNNILYKLAQ